MFVECVATIWFPSGKVLLSSVGRLLVVGATFAWVHFAF